MPKIKTTKNACEAKYGGGKLFRAIPAKHDDISGGNRDLGDLGPDQRQPKRQCRPDMSAPALLFPHVRR
jgi:hypothetical protein